MEKDGFQPNDTGVDRPGSRTKERGEGGNRI